MNHLLPKAGFINIDIYSVNSSEDSRISRIQNICCVFCIYSLWDKNENRRTVKYMWVTLKLTQ